MTLAARSAKWRSNQALNTSSIDPLRFENTPFLSHEAVVHLRLAPPHLNVLFVDQGMHKRLIGGHPLTFL
jgi:hypothetical protein